MTDVLSPGFTITPAAAPHPIVLASPHSGRDYPPAFLAQTRLTLAQLRRAEDAFVAELLGEAVAHGVPLIAARYGRAWLDLNREEAELDPAMFVDPLDAHPAQSSDRVVAGLGVVPRIAAAGLEIYPGRVRSADAAARIDAVHRPYHAALSSLLDDARAANGFAVLLDCHSMPTPPPVQGGAPQIVIGDLFGAAAAAPLVTAIERHFSAAGFRVARNAPYAGGHTTARHGRPEQGIHAVQIEIDRVLYMDPARLVRHMGFGRIETTLAGLVAKLLASVGTMGLGPFAVAAE
nr:N-formylglutamate amidohydrolase [Polymorphobacter sp.]